VGALYVTLRNARREKLDDSVDLHIVAVRTNVVVARKRARGTHRLVFEIDGGQPYLVKAFPSRHRAVGQIILMPFDGSATAELFCPLDPEQVSDVRFPKYAGLPIELRRVLDRSIVEGSTSPTPSGSALYADLTDIQRAGLLNLFAKMDSFGFDETHTVWSAVERIYRIRPDRVFADVDVALRDRVKAEVVSQRFHEVSGKLHKPPPGFVFAGSFKTDERYGNLQLSFFSRAQLELRPTTERGLRPTAESETTPIAFKVDADIDDAAGVGHVFQVLRNFVTDGTTHPYDIHQILTFRQEVAPLYDLA
jgi:hypothetical protein